jgi:hypothetical protein
MTHGFDLYYNELFKLAAAPGVGDSNGVSMFYTQEVSDDPSR